MWASDYPHPDSTFPHSREAIAHAFAGLDAAFVGRSPRRTARVSTGSRSKFAPMRGGPEGGAPAAGMGPWWRLRRRAPPHAVRMFANGWRAPTHPGGGNPTLDPAWRQRRARRGGTHTLPVAVFARSQRHSPPTRTVGDESAARTAGARAYAAMAVAFATVASPGGLGCGGLRRRDGWARANRGRTFHGVRGARRRRRHQGPIPAAEPPHPGPPRMCGGRSETTTFSGERSTAARSSRTNSTCRRRAAAWSASLQAGARRLALTISPHVGQWPTGASERR